MGFVNRYVSLAGRNCCAGRSWVGLDRSLARRACETPPQAREPVNLDASATPHGTEEPLAVEDVRA
jgi:hypothetical protein